MSQYRFPDLAEAFWNLPVYLFGNAERPIWRGLVWIWRAMVLCCAVYIALAGLSYEWFLWATPR